MLGTMKQTLIGWPAACFLLLMGVLFTAGALRTVGIGSGTARGRMDDWDVPQLARHLRERGLEFGVKVPGKQEAAFDAAFFTQSGASWEQVRYLPKVPECADLWRGVVYCEKVRPDGSWAPEMTVWGNCGLEVRPFVFFGDPEMLGLIRDALSGNN